MSADLPGNTTYSSGFGPRTGTIRKTDPYTPSPRTPRATDSTSPVNLSKLSHSLTEQYKLKKSRDETADRVLADVEAFHKQETEKVYSARRQREAYKDSLQDQIRLRNSSRDSARKNELESKKQINHDFEGHVKETLKQKEDQRQRHLEYCKQVQQQQAETTNLNAKKKTSDEAVAEMMIRDSQQKKAEDEEKKNQKRNLQKQLADEMKRIQDEKIMAKERQRKQQEIDDKIYLKYVDEKAAQEEHDRANLNHSKQKILPSVVLPKLETRTEAMPNYISILASEKKEQAMNKAEQQRRYRETLQKQIEDKNLKKGYDIANGLKARTQAEQDAVAYSEEQAKAKQLVRERAKENEDQLSHQMRDSVRRRYRLDDEEWGTLTGTQSRK
eukprot:GILI01014024.1.p1 GENE.GILI01014024.1~~GILI01014024.1.p1  ORF type:complete len:401 (-),score=44.20 GILI01014024.1:50-1207(-)